MKNARRSESTLEKRMDALEKEVAELRTKVDRLTAPKDWRSTIGMFAGDEVMRQIEEEGRKIREKDRERARRAAARRARK
jgi:hypothetical protein